MAGIVKRREASPCPVETQLLVAGHWQMPAGPSIGTIRNPATLEPIPAVAAADREQWERALMAGRGACADWRRRSATERQALLYKVGERLLMEADLLARLHARETGQAFMESLDVVRQCAAWWMADADSAGRAAPEDHVACVVHRPRADQPLIDWAWIATRSLRRGAACVTGLDTAAPLTVLLAAAACDALPPGLISVLTGAPELPGAARLHDTECIAPTDEAPPQDTIFVSKDADMELAIAGVAAMRLFHSGQRTEQSARVYVESPFIYGFADRLHEYIAMLEAGDPVKPGTDLGPLFSAGRIQRVEAQVAQQLKQGALLKLGGRRYQPWGLTGYFFQPTLLIQELRGEAGPDESIAGPVIILLPARTLAAALADRPPGRAVRVALFTADRERVTAGLRADGIECSVRDYSVAPWRRPLRADVPHVQIESISARGEDWFPYSARCTQAVRA